MNSELKRLNFEDIIWVIFIITSILNIIGNSYQKQYIRSNNQYYEDIANNVYTLVLIIVLFIYLYFFNRNYNMYKSKKNNATEVDFIKVMGSLFFIIGTLCLIYFQTNSDDNFIGGPAI